MNHNIEKRYRARKLLDSGKIGEALSLLEQNIKDSPTDSDSIYLSGICCARSGNHASAEKYFRKTVKMNKGLFQAFTDLGSSQSSQRKFSEAIRSFKKALTINPEFAPAHSNIALAYLQTQEVRKALHNAKKIS
jgi:tetratricopeptide (TPR) repeat protein